MYTAENFKNYISNGKKTKGTSIINLLTVSEIEMGQTTPCNVEEIECFLMGYNFTK